MTWTRLPDDFTDRPTVLRLSRSARLLHVEALVWCNRLLTDGVIPANVLRRISDSADLDRDVAELADSGLWTRLDDEAWRVDWSDQELAEKVEARRQQNRDRQHRYNKRRERHALGDHSHCTPKYCDALGNPSSNASRNPSDDGLPTRPVPSRPEGEGRGRGGGGVGSWGGAAPRAAASASPPTEPAFAAGPPPTARIYVDEIEVSTP
jgi:hypothetical protein